jgi:hypothetical protein
MEVTIVLNVLRFSSVRRCQLRGQQRRRIAAVALLLTGLCAVTFALLNSPALAVPALPYPNDNLLSNDVIWGPPPGWVTSIPVTVSVQVTDSIGITDSSPLYRYSVDAGATFTEWTSANLTYTIQPTTTAYITITNLPFVESGTSNIITFRVMDTSGSPITSTGYVVPVDTLAPGIPQLLDVHPRQQWTNGMFRMSWTNPPDTSGIGGVYYKLDTAPITNTDGILVPGLDIKLVPTITVTSNGKHHIFAWLKDNAGNVDFRYSSAIPDALWYDGTPPTTTATLTGTVGTNDWYRSTVTVTLSPIDATSGVSDTLYQLDNGDWQRYYTTTLFSFTDDGIHMLSYYSVDVASNREITKTTAVKVDTVLPSTGVTLTGKMIREGWYSSAVTVTLSVTETTSGVDATFYRVDREPWLPYTTPFTVSKNGDHTVDYYSVDRADNKEGLGTITFKIGPARVYLPLVLRNYYPPTPTPTPTPIPTPRPIQNPSFEDGLNYWQTAGVVVPSSEWQTHGQYSARLGDPGYRCDGGGVVGKNGVTQTFNVPTTGSTTLALDYKIVTQDSLLENGDYLQIEINGSPVQTIGWQQAASGCLGQPNIITGTYSIDLLGLGHQRGAGIKLGIFIVIVDQYYNTYGYIDSVRWGTP